MPNSVQETVDGIPISDGFDFPVGPRGDHVDVFKHYKIDATLADPAYYKQFEIWHTGEDWNGRGGGDTDLGDPVYAIAHGKVMDFGNYPDWGNLVLIEHVLPDDSLVWSQYAHLDEMMVTAEGQTVSRGQQIGTIGKGPQTSEYPQGRYLAHLHFELRRTNLPIDNWLPMVKDRKQVLANYLEPTPFIEARRPGSQAPSRERMIEADTIQGDVQQTSAEKKIREPEPKAATPPEQAGKFVGTHFGQKLRDLRSSAELSQQALAERLEKSGFTIHRREISNYETGSRTPDRPQLIALIQSLVKAGVIQTQTIANELLESANYELLNADEINQIFAKTAAQIQRHFDITTHALSDAPTTNDLLGFSVYVEALAKFIEDPNTKKPITIAIDAPWGMGKSSLMRMLEQRLARPGQTEVESEKPIAKQKLPSSPTVWFNAWQYDQSEAIWANLVLEILEQVGQRLGFFKRLWMKWQLDSKRFDLRGLLQNVIQYLLVYVLGITLLGLAVTIIALLFLDSTLAGVWRQVQAYLNVIGWGAFITSIFAVGQEVVKKLSQPLNLKLEDYFNRPDYQEKAGFLPQLQADFKRVVEVVTQNGRWPLIIFIDDLDRCEPPKPVDIVEAINLLLNSEHCVFIIGMDTRTVAGSIEAKYKNMLGYLDNSIAGQLTFGQQFLEKIVQIRFRIPRTNPAEFEKFIQKHLVVSAESSPAEVEEVRHKQKVIQAAALMKAEQREAPKPVPAPDAAAAVQQKASGTFTLKVIEEAQQQVQADEALFDKNPDVQQTIIAAAEYFSYNPRQVKRFINFYRLQAFIAQQRHLLDQKDFDLGLLGKWLILSTGWPDAVTAIRRDRNFITHFFNAADRRKQIVDHQTGEDPQFIEQEDFQRIKSQLDAYLQDPTLARLVDNRQLIKLLAEIKNTENIQRYLDLAAISAEAAEEDTMESATSFELAG